MRRTLLGYGCRELKDRGQVVGQLMVEVIARIEEELLVREHLLGLLAEIGAVVRCEVEVRVLREVEGAHVCVLVLLRIAFLHVVKELLEHLARLRTRDGMRLGGALLHVSPPFF